MTFADSKQRFSNRVADYVRYRPRYPEAVLDFLRSECSLRPEHAIADIGSGTGFLSELFLKNGNRVFGVEPNEGMRQAGEDLLARYPNFVSVNGSAEATTLAAASVDFITAGQAFHWFEPATARREFQRILRPPGWIAILWYHRPLNKSSFTDTFEDLLIRFGTDYEKVRDAYPKSKDIASFLGNKTFSTREFPSTQEFGREGLTGLVKSTSYVPDQNHANYAPMMVELEKLFRENEKDGLVRLENTTTVYCGRLDGNGTNL
ncbi:MAG TPA: class I SAM-dependent methyltransferase [Candidatus Dormibacteraeota bacterium]|nr:class I SAM-dependent methyltransferase [Candidatus Dormibacteraeota bacterium]